MTVFRQWASGSTSQGSLTERMQASEPWGFRVTTWRVVPSADAGRQAREKSSVFPLLRKTELELGGLKAAGVHRVEMQKERFCPGDRGGGLQGAPAPPR